MTFPFRIIKVIVLLVLPLPTPSYTYRVRNSRTIYIINAPHVCTQWKHLRSNTLDWCIKGWRGVQFL